MFVISFFCCNFAPRIINQYYKQQKKELDYECSKSCRGSETEIPQ